MSELETLSGVWIDAKSRTVENVIFPIRFFGDSESTLRNLYQMIDSEEIRIAQNLKHGDVLWTDLEGIDRQVPYGFVLNGKPHVGNGVILGIRSDGVALDSKLQEAEVEESLHFFNPVYSR